MNTSRIGIWLIGAKGGVGGTALLGLTALQKGLIDKAGLVSELRQFTAANLADWGRFVVAGHEIRRIPLAEAVERFTAENRMIDPKLVAACRGELEQIDRRIRPGTIRNVGQAIAALADADLPQEKSPREIIARLRGDFQAFLDAEKLDHLIVVNVASTEPPAPNPPPPSWSELDAAFDDPQSTLPASTLYAIAALGAGYSYVNFTPSLGSAPAAVDELARRSDTRHYGCDGKTGETLMKSVLAPMFARRNLQVLSWVGHNIFGNMDARVLDDPANKQSKVVSKDRLVREILGYAPKTIVSLENLPDLGDWKTAWDHIHFQGFLGLPMTLQFIWHGSDSILAAPLVLDLIRFTELAHRRRHVGPMPFLASFFKSPYGVSDHNFERQFQMLEGWVGIAAG
ncbi:MAG: inositol-3-phosphate synthase [Pirellulales bacterium]|nr:inositol-3-phosphate synthase [Pirellulales bacterium]